MLLAVDGNGNPLTSISAGQSIYIEVDFTTQNLPSDASYRIAYTVNGETLESGYITDGAGASGTGDWDYTWGQFIASPGENQVTVTVDPDHSVPETTYANNTMSFSFHRGVTGGGRPVVHGLPDPRGLR